MTINLSEHAGGGNYEVYDPGMMTFNGTDAYYEKTSVSISGNALTMVARCNIAPFTGGGSAYIAALSNVSTARLRVRFLVFSDDYATAGRQNKVAVTVGDNGGSAIAYIYSDVDICDSTDKVIFFSYDATAGTAILYVDGVDADDTLEAGRVLTTGTMETGATFAFDVAAYSSGVGLLDGQVGYVGYKDSYLTNPTDFYHPTNGLQELDESGWTEWGSQPLFWNASGFMEDNKGSAGDMTKNGVIDLASPSTIIIPAGLGLNTIGDAVAADIAADKIAWVDGEQIIGTG